MEFPTDVVAPAGAVALVVWLTQITREGLRLPPRLLPFVAVAYAGGLAALAGFAPPAIRDAVVLTLGVAWAASTSIRYVKKGDA